MRSSQRTLEACLMQSPSVPQKLVGGVPAQNQLTVTPKSIFFAVRQSHAGHNRLSEKSTTSPGVTSVSPLTPVSPPNPPTRDHQHRLPVPPFLRLEQAQPLGTSQSSLHPQHCQPGAAVPLTSPISSQLSVPSHMAHTLGSHIQEEMQAVSNPHFIPASAKLVHGKDLAAIHPPALCLHLLCPGEPAEDRQGCLQHPQLSSCSPVGAGAFSVPGLCHGSCPRQLFPSSSV